ncbi:MAG TPA: hypothetical protein VNT26_14360 [Candidatus Sulfotelmatobacter sp.]|nr:hypothetical protein [Candidatus Sulfotelmatobacter sp.]HWI57392.1 hypothetical protein [Bacillota bacterium]
MRVTGNSITNTLISQLNLLAARQVRLQSQATTGQRIQAPEDDPAAMGRALTLQAEDTDAGQYARNISTLQHRAGTVSDAFAALKKISDRAGEIATLADGTRSPQELQIYGTELRQLIQQAVQLANTRDGDQYVFAGTRGDQSPYAATTDTDGNVAAVAYQGNASVAPTEIAQGSTLSVTAPGENNAGTGPRGVFSDSRYGADFFNHLIALQNHLLTGNTTAISTQDRLALQHDEDNLIFQTANNGVVQARLETAAADTDTRKLSTRQALADVAGADLTDTLVQLNQTQNAYQVALQSSAKILQLQQSLLNYLP